MIKVRFVKKVEDVEIQNGATIEVNFKTGRPGIQGKSAYQSYVDTTTDDPILTEEQWSATFVLPDNVVIDADYVHTDNNLTDELKSSIESAVQPEDLTVYVESVTSTDNNIVVDNTDPQNPILSFQTVDNQNFLTDDELAVVQATSGTNTGDQDLSDLQPKTDALLETDSDTIVGAINEVNSIAKGASNARVFVDVAALDAWLAIPANVALLNIGDAFYIKDVDVPDYWWDGAQKQELETQKVDLTNYYTKTETDQAIEDYAAPIAHDHFEQTIKPDVVEYQLTPTVPTAKGSQFWDVTHKVLSTVLGNGVVLQNGLEMYVRIVNKTGIQINDGQVVYINGAQGNRPTVALAQANSSTAANVLGVATENIAYNAEGFITIIGEVSFNTSGYADGADLYLSATTAGDMTAIEPAYPNHKVIVGKALNSTNNGRICVNPQHIYELAELHGVDLTETTPLDTDSVLIQQATTGLVKKSLLSTLKTFLSGAFVKLDQTVSQTIGSATARLTNVFASKMQTDLITKLNGSGIYAKEDGGTTYHTTKWFTPTGTFSSVGTAVTTTDGQLTASMVGAKIGVGEDKRIITAYLTANTCTVESAFSQNYSGVVSGSWGVYSKEYEIVNGQFTHYLSNGFKSFSGANGATDGALAIYKGTDTASTCGFSVLRSSDLFPLMGLFYQYGESQWLYNGNTNLLLDGTGIRVLRNIRIDTGYSFLFRNSSGTVDTGIRRKAKGKLEAYDGVTLGALAEIQVSAIKAGLVLETQLTTATNNTAITSIAVDQTTNFPATGTILIGGVTSVAYTSKTATSLVFASTTIPTYASGTAVLVTDAGNYVTIDETGIKFKGTANVIKPDVNATNGMRFTDKDSNDIMVVDSVNKMVGINCTPAHPFDLNGRVRSRGKNGSGGGFWLTKSSDPTGDFSYIGRGNDSEAFVGIYNGGWAFNILDSNRNIGIGYTSGTEITNNKLAVNGSSLATTAKGGTTTDYAQLDANGIRLFGTANVIKPDVDSTTAVRVTKADGTTDVVVIDTTNAKVLINGNVPSMVFNQANASSGNKRWDVMCISGEMRWRLVNDNDTFANNYMTIKRSGTDVTSVAFPLGRILIGATDNGTDKLQINGSSLATTAKGGTTTDYVQNDATGTTYFGKARKRWNKYTAQSITFTTGSTADAITTLQSGMDGTYMTIVEASGVPGIDCYVEFTSVNAFERVRLLTAYVGTASHQVMGQVYDWVGAAWKTFDTIESAAFNTTDLQFQNHEFTVYDDTNYIGTAGNLGKVRVRFYHPVTGNSSHRFYIDELSLRQ